MDTRDLAALAADVDGPVFGPTDAGYPDECATYNLLNSLRPAVVVGATNVRDVQAAVRFAAAHDVPLAIRGGGHMQRCDAAGAVLVTLDRMNGVEIDVSRATARISGAARWRDVLAKLPTDLAPLSGSASTVGAIGYTLGGGQGPILSRLHGYASGHVTALDVVTADGVHRSVDENTDPELFFALRGSRGNLGVVTAMTIKLFPVKEIYAGGLWFAGERSREVLARWRDFSAGLPDEATSSVAIQRLPPIPELPEPLRGAFVVHVRFAYVGQPSAGQALLEDIRALGAPLMDTVRVMPYSEVAEIHADPPQPLPYVDRSIGLREVTDETLDALLGVVGPETGCPLASVELRALGGALDRAPAVADSVPSRGLPFQLFGFGVGAPEEAARLRTALDDVMATLAPWAHPRRMLNFLAPDEATDPTELRAVYGDELYDRLVSIKGKYDPTNMFRMNHNIIRVADSGPE